MSAVTKAGYAALTRSFERAVPKTRIATGRLQRLSYGTGASFYRLIPEIVVTVERSSQIKLSGFGRERRENKRLQGKLVLAGQGASLANGRF